MSFGQEEDIYEEIPVFLNVQQYGGTEINAVISDESVYLPINEVFNFLKIKNTISPDLNFIEGFFINLKSEYHIDRKNNRIIFQDKTHQLKPGDLIRTDFNLLLKSNLFGSIFGLDCSFNFRSLSVTLTTKLELPVIREMKLEQMRSNINRLKGEIKTDTTIKRNYPFFSLGMADWSVFTSQHLKGTSDARLNFTLGSVIAGGEANIGINYNSNSPFSEKEQYYLWRFVNNEHRTLRQVMAGKISSPSTSSIFNPIVGIQFTNTPSTYRRSFGTYTLSDITEPNWTVELYVNSVLVDYVKADASGFFKFEVPLVYGNSAVMLRFYGPWGEEKTREVNISIPFNFLPHKELEYSVSAGVVEDSLYSRYSRAMVHYGLIPRLTIGGGIEYLSSLGDKSSMPFFNSSLRLGSSLLLSGEYTYGVRFKGLLSYRLPSDLQLELNYSRYDKNQRAIIFNYLEERKAVISMPVRAKHFSAYSRLTYNQIVLENMNNTNAELLLSGTFKNVSTNITTYGLFNDPSDPYIYSHFSLAFRLPLRITLTPQVQYEYTLNKLISTKAHLEKSLFTNGYLSFGYEQNFKSKINSVEFSLRYDFPFAQTGLSSRVSNERTSFVQSARGSLLYNPKQGYLGTNNRSSVGKGAITFIPFLDINCNGRRDPNEFKVPNLDLRVNGGKIVPDVRDTLIHVVDLVPYTSYFVEINKNSFENITWQIQKATMTVNIDANRFKTIEIPVAVMGEAAGMVYEKGVGKGQIRINFYRNDSTLAGQTISESDGYFSFMGLGPGSYFAKIDPLQLERIKQVQKTDYKVSPLSLPFTIAKTKDGDVVDGLEFSLEPLSGADVEKNTVPEPTAPEKKDSSLKITPAQERDMLSTAESQKQAQTALIPKKDIVMDNLSVSSAKRDSLKEALPVVQKIGKDSTGIRKITAITPAFASKAPDLISDSIVVQAGAFSKKTNAETIVYKIEEKYRRKCSIVFENGFYKVRISGFRDNGEAVSFIAGLPEIGIFNAFVYYPDQIYSIQVVASGSESNARILQRKLFISVGRPVDVISENGLFKVRISGFYSYKDAELYLEVIRAKGYPDAFIKGENNKER